MAETSGDDDGKTMTKMQMSRNPSVISLAIARTASYPGGASSMDSKELMQGLYKGVLLYDDKVKFWVDDKLLKNCFMLFATGFSRAAYGVMNLLTVEKEECLGGPVHIRVLDLMYLGRLDISGKLPSIMLSPMTTYEIVFVFKMFLSTSGFNCPVNLGFNLPNRTTRNQTEDLGKKPKGQWFEICLGDFEVTPENIGYIKFFLNGRISPAMSLGVLLKCVIFRPKY